jgi:Tol biopolymer transport system component
MLADTTGWRGPQEDIENPAWSPDGERVVYAKRGQDGSNADPIVQVASNDPQFDLYRSGYSLSYSPDGRRVLFAGAFVGAKALMVMNADGSGQRALFDAKDVGIVSPSWSPDGRQIVFAMGRYGLRNPNTPAQLALVRSDGSGLHILTHGMDNSGYPSFSPDGSRLVYRVFGSQQGLRILSLDDAKITKLTSAWDDFPMWSPRGDRILFTGFRTGDFDIYTIRPDGSDLRQLTHDHGNDAHAVWSPDGQSILFTSSRMGWKDESLLGGGRSGQPYGEIFVMDADGTHLRQLTDDQWEESADAWLLPARR